MNILRPRRKSRYVWYLLFGWLLVNHAVRLITLSAKNSGNDLSATLPEFVSGLLVEVNSFRIDTGKRISKGATYCPQTINGFCVITAESMNVILGLGT